MYQSITCTDACYVIVNDCMCMYVYTFRYHQRAANVVCTKSSSTEMKRKIEELLNGKYTTYNYTCMIHWQNIIARELSL